ncbi:hypothetical protein R2R35_16640 [Anaerocolumna sp. AGMB13020]|uniref:hypothetical protein n=1 Tax=Anaerocolumna sp. AGMB13020 TaxID=3081750 RepID=UPI002954088B|nr:hypothetical protein [Anaerocolumna sp. AGMB13020]WOO35416.1 hypothetical protein R2R35_16640 [Anaerocolumna sp. AGMB13020]
MKLILKTGEELQINSIFMLAENRLSISFGSIESFDELKAKLTGTATEELKAYITDDTYSVYEDYTIMVNPSTVTRTSDGTLDVVIILEKEDELSKMKKTIATLNPVINLDTCTLDELKVYQIAKSKKALEIYLEANPITSDCHGGIEKKYSITKEKQSLLTQEIAIVQMAIQAGIEYQPSWNAADEPLTYDWTLEELKQLAFEVVTLVKPLVRHQQTIESNINAAQTKEDVLAESIEY